MSHPKKKYRINPPCKIIQKFKLLQRRKHEVVLLKPLKGVATTDVSLHFNQPRLASSLIRVQQWPACRVPEWLTVVFKLNSLNRHTCSSAEIGSLSNYKQRFSFMLLFYYSTLEIIITQ